MLLPSSIAHPEPEWRQGREEGCEKTTHFSTVCKIKGCISPWVRLHRENAQPGLHVAIMTTATNALCHGRRTQRVGSLCGRRRSRVPCREQFRGPKELSPSPHRKLAEPSIPPSTQGGPATCGGSQSSRCCARTPPNQKHPAFPCAGC